MREVAPAGDRIRHRGGKASSCGESQHVPITDPVVNERARDSHEARLVYADGGSGTYVGLWVTNGNSWTGTSYLGWSGKRLRSLKLRLVTSSPSAAASGQTLHLGDVVITQYSTHARFAAERGPLGCTSPSGDSVGSGHFATKGGTDMKYVVAWTSHDSSEEAGRRSLEVFSKWTPAGNFVEFLSRLDGSGGFAIVEAENPVDVLRDTSKFSAWLEFEVYPVVDMSDAVLAFGEAIEFRDSVN